MDIEELLGSKGRLRVLKAILYQGEINITGLVRMTKLHHRLVIKHVEYLERVGIVRVRKVGRMRWIEARFDDPRVVALRDLFRQIEHL